MPIQTVDANTLKSWLDKNETMLVDVREPAEHESTRIPGATSIPLGTICCGNLPDTRGKKLVLHCKAGKRGTAACEKLLKENPDLEIYNLEGGLDAWTQAGHMVHTSDKKILPLDQQVQLAIGIGVVTGSLLGYFGHPVWFLLSGFFGLGLINAGLTGWCGLAMLMAKMPWNQTKTFCQTGIK